MDRIPKNEKELSKLVLLKASELKFRLFRNNNGMAWVGKSVTKFPNGDVLIREATPIRYGLGNGSGDYIGWRPMFIYPEMVGTTVAVYSNIEIKNPNGRGRTSAEQLNMNEQVLKAGGISVIINDLNEFENKFK